MPFEIALKEYVAGLEGIDGVELERAVRILSSHCTVAQGSEVGKVVCLGAGRMGMQAYAFSMRLSHLGFNSYFLGDSSLPRIGPNDLVVINSSSGETPSMVLLAQIAAQAGAKILLISGSRESTLWELSNYQIKIPQIESAQLMKTYYEAISGMIFDELALSLVEVLNLDVAWVEKNHSILE